MARFNTGVHGGYSGKVGNVVGASWRQIDYIRSLPKLLKNRPVSERQLAQRTRFTLAVSFLAPLKELLNMGFRDEVQGRATGYNVGLRRFINNAITGSYPDYEVDYPSVVLSSGGVGQLMAPTLSPGQEGGLYLRWYPLTGGSAHMDDEVIVAVYNREKAFVLSLEQIEREAGAALIPVPSVFEGDTLEVFAFVMRRGRSASSNSQHIGSIMIDGDMISPDMD